ncbi:MAG TPA: trehalose-phosphatase [Aquabacterium sp.]|uniref:trehalose-phosphatase n=1 Tax=Aquabacterium sp. TaxID=1872578 RepID=UPI002E332DEE|nr:trehalose-phosphatase [Aquabacterium sp.]HEX5357936.1 trehalose-phosphatase [Aquabacterium sp.]
MPDKTSKRRLLAPANRSLLLELAQDNTLFAFDFDGTLAPIVGDPQKAFLPHPTWHALSALSRMAKVAVISGRSQTDLQRRLPVEVAYVIGNHGNEGFPVEDRASRIEQEHCCSVWLRQLLAQNIASHDWHHVVGATIEDKGRTLCMHYRHCANHEQAHAVLSQFATNLIPPAQVVEGLATINLLPLRARNKGDAMRSLMTHSGCARALFIGDDMTDELAFAVAPSGWITAKVGRADQSLARFRLNNTREVRTLLELLVWYRQSIRPQATLCTGESTV